MIEVDGLVATVDFWGLRKQVRLDVVDAPVAPGDYVLNHVGFAIRRIPAGRPRTPSPCTPSCWRRRPRAT
ncbi:MAG: HypC/HybG/HupF family hydrogenase formation chaperone [Myxococcaceae bacterium]